MDIKKEIRNVWVYGIGGVGGYFGGKIAAQLANDEKRRVFFIARGQHLDEIQKNGLILHSGNEKTFCRPMMATDKIAELPAADLILLCVKSYHLDQVMQDLKPYIDDNTIIIPLLNGVDIYERMRRHLNKGIIIPSCVYIVSRIEKAGVIKQDGSIARICSGTDPLKPGRHPEITQFFEDMGIDYHWFDDPYPAIWEKFLFIAPLNLINAVAGRTLGEVLEDEGLRTMLQGIVREIITIAGRKGVQLDKDIYQSTMEKFYKFSPDLKTSYQRDVEQQGKANEGDIFGESILDMGKEFAVATPLTEQALKEIDKRVKHL